MEEDLFVVKIGGNIVDDEAKLDSFLREFASLRVNRILAHGGGKLATRMADKLGIPQQLVEGRRITDAETLKIATMVYAGYINKNIVARLQANHCNAIGICGADANLIEAHRRKHPVIDYGYVGDVDRVNTSLLVYLLQQSVTVVLAPLTHDKKGQLLNTNADTIAQEIAKAMSGAYRVSLLYTFEKNGVLSDANDENSLIPFINPVSYKKLKENKTIFAGMIPKLDNAFEALNAGVKKVIIGNSENLRQLVCGDSGTTISNS